jgi:EAL domain-containing protein (putative c-di-GMP-specific phosphodiesterase class I)
MRTAPPTSDDLFIAKKGRISRGLGRVNLPHRSSHSDRGPKLGDVEAEQLRQEREQLIRVTIANRTFETHFQPIVDLRSGRPVGAEALSRFSHLPVQAPDTWFAEAASVGLGVELELAALDMALGQLHLLPADLYLSVNASVETIMSADFQAALGGIPAERIVLELTEHTQVSNYQKLEQSVEEIRAKGVRLAVDDAGSGYSSLQHILNLQPDVIKLDIALTRGIDKDPARQALGRALLTFGLDAYNASIVAEGIETVGEFETLRSLGCPSGQGYYLGRPGRMRAPHQASSNSALALVPPPDAEIASPLLWPHHDTGFEDQANEVGARLASATGRSKSA